jgi:hypothetical protein
MSDHEAGSPGTAHAPTTLQIELFRTMEDIHEMTGALVVLLVDAEGRSIAVSGDEADLPAPLRAVLGGRRLKVAGSVIALLSPIAGDLAGSRLNVSVYDVDGAHVLAIAFGADADFATVESVGREARAMLCEILRTSLS